MEDTIITDQPLIRFLDKLGQLILLSICWIVGSLPVITLGTSTTALYYAVMKSIRRERGYPMGEFWSSYRSNVKRGIPATVAVLLIAGLLCVNVWTAANAEPADTALLLASVLLLALLCLTGTCLWPVLSRFSMGLWSACKLAFVMAFRFLPHCLCIMAGTAVLTALQIWILPAPTVVLIPGVWCYVTTFIMEKALRKFMPEKQEDDDAWYYE